MATRTVREPSIRKVRQVLSEDKLSFLLIFITALMAYMLIMIRTTFEALVWYSIFILLLWVYISSVSQIEGRRNFLLSIHEYDLSKALPPIIIWGVFAFIIFGLFFKTVGTDITFPSMPVLIGTLIHQIFIASAETIIFAVLLPEAIGSFGRIPFTKDKIPGWFWGAGVYFAAFHIPAYLLISFDLTTLGYRLFFAFCMGLVFYTLYKYGETNSQVGGITGAIALHWVWNMWAILTASVIIFGF
jgi:hypothetical protein